MTKTYTHTPEERLVDLAVWAAGEHAKQRLGLPSEWKQSNWMTKDPRLSCGTACCIAGKVALDDGVLPEWWKVAEAGESIDDVLLPGGVTRPIDEYARNVLGLDWAEADRLFGGENVLDDVLDAIQDILAERRVSAR